MRWLPRRRRAPRPVPSAPAAQLAAVVDELADAYCAARPLVSALLARHARAYSRYEAAVIDPHAEEWQLATLAAEAEGTRAALLGLSPTAAQILTGTTLETHR